MVALFLILYSIPLVYVIKNRSQAVIKSRSPIITASFIVMLFLDSVLNTIIFQLHDDSKGKAMLKCYLGIWVTMVIMIPILLSMYFRIYRVKRVFELYEKYMRVCIRTGSILSLEAMPTISNLGDDENLKTSSNSRFLSRMGQNSRLRSLQSLNERGQSEAFISKSNMHRESKLMNVSHMLSSEFQSKDYFVSREIYTSLDSHRLIHLREDASNTGTGTTQQAPIVRQMTSYNDK